METLSHLLLDCFCWFYFYAQLWLYWYITYLWMHSNLGDLFIVGLVTIFMPLLIASNCLNITNCEDCKARHSLSSPTQAPLLKPIFSKIRNNSSSHTGPSFETSLIKHKIQCNVLSLSQASLLKPAYFIGSRLLLNYICLTWK